MFLDIKMSTYKYDLLLWAVYIMFCFLVAQFTCQERFNFLPDYSYKIDSSI